MLIRTLPIFELLLLFLLSRQITISLSLFLQYTKFNQKIIILFIAIFFLPGTLVHELAHWIMAKLLIVPTGAISLIPHLQGNSIRMGSVVVAKVDKLRQLLIGLAPILIGLAILFCSFYFLLPYLPSFSYLFMCLFVYLIFVISNSMFSSKKDLEGSLLLLCILVLLLSIWYLIQPQVLINLLYYLLYLLPLTSIHLAIFYLAIPLALDICILVVLTLLIRLLD